MSDLAQLRARTILNSTLPIPSYAELVQRFGATQASMIQNIIVGNTETQTPSPSYVAPAPYVAPVDTIDLAKQRRMIEMQSFTGWDNIDTVKALQVQSWSIYVNTGLWNTDAQIALNQQAQNIRKATNIMYDPNTMPFGASNPAQAAQIALPQNITGLAGIAEGVTTYLPVLIIGFVLLLVRR